MAASPWGIGAARHNRHLFDRHFFGLIGRHDDVLVVGQDDDLIGGQVLERVQNILRGGVHGLPAFDDGGHAQAGKDAAQPCAG